MSNGVYILGGGGHAKVAISSLRSAGEHVSEVFDDDKSKEGALLLGVSIGGPTPDKEWWQAGSRRAFIAIGDNIIRARLSIIGAKWVVAKHAHSYVHESVRPGEGTLICAGVVIQPDTMIGRHVIANTSCSIDHDCVIDSFAHIGPGVILAGGVQVGEAAFLGAGAKVMPGLRIGEGAVVGAGAVVTRNVPDGQTVVGVPARELKNG